MSATPSNTADREARETAPESVKNPVRAFAHISKKRWSEACCIITEAFGNNERTRQMIAQLQRVFRFDPELPAYTADQSARMTQWRKHKAERLGLSVYELSGGKRAYEKKCNQRVSASE